MNDLYTILENIVIFLSKDVIYKIIVPLIIICLIIDIIRYMFAKDDTKETIIGAIQKKAIGFVLLVTLPFLVIWFLNFVSKVAGVEVDVDTSILEKLTGKKVEISKD